MHDKQDRSDRHVAPATGQTGQGNRNSHTEQASSTMGKNQKAPSMEKSNIFIVEKIIIFFDERF